MPPRAFPIWKKSRPEVQYDELQRALLERMAAQTSAEQPSASAQHQPSASAQQPPSAEQRGFAQPSHSPVLPLVLLTLSIHSTSGSIASTTTGAGLLPVRSIRSRNAVAEATVSGVQASSSTNKKRGVITGKRTEAIVHASGKSRVTYEPAVSGPPKEVRSRIVREMSAFIKSRVTYFV